MISPEIHQSWHGEGSLYYFISEKGFQKIPTEKKILTMELTANPEKRTLCENTDQRAGLRGK